MKIQRAMTGSEISRELEISRQAVSQSLKRAINKMYSGLMEQGITSNPTDTILHMREFLNVTNEEDIQEFIELLPKEVRTEIKEHARNYKSKPD